MLATSKATRPADLRGAAKNAAGRSRPVAVRLIGAGVVCLGGVTLVFLLGAWSGQDPARARLGPYADAAARRAFDRAHGLDDPLVVRYWRYLSQIVHGDLGNSLVNNQPIAGLIGKALPVTASLAILAAIVATVASLVFGCAAALRRGGIVDKLVLLLSSIGLALPTFWVGLLVIEVFAVKHHDIPSGGYRSLSQGIGPWLHALIAPVLVLALPFAASTTRTVRAAMVEELAKDYVRTARGIGLRSITIVLRNVLKNAMVAPVTVLGLRFGGLFAGAVLVESVFRLPGIGQLIVTAVAQGDFGVVQAASIVTAVAFVVVNLLVDLLHRWISPRLRTGR